MPDVAPDTQAPNDLQNIQPGAAQGVEDLGAGFQKAAAFYDSASADNAFNDYQSKAVKLLYGDPTKPGPDGQPDLGFMGLKGRAAMDARPQIEATLDGLQKDTLGSLNNDAQRAQFETYSRRYRNSAAIDIGSHTDQQSNAWYTQVNTDTEKNALDAISSNPLDPRTVLNAASDLTNARVKTAVLNGANPVPGDPQYDEAVSSAKKDAFKAQVQAVGTSDPARALRMLQKSPDLAGTDYAQLYDGLRTRANDQVASDFVTGRVQTYTGQAQDAYKDAPTNPTQPVYQQTVEAVPGPYSPAGLARTVQLESGGKDVTNASGHAGYGQFSDETWREFGAGGDPHNLNDSVAAIQRYGAANAKGFAATFGRQPTDAESYIMHQQGGTGGLALLTHPDLPAASLIGAKAVIQNGGTQGMTAGQFVAMWTHKFNGTTPSADSAIPPITAGSRAELAPAAPVQSQPDQGGGEDQTAVPAVANTVPAAASTQADAPTPGVLPTDIKSQVFADIDASDMNPEQKQLARTKAAQQIQAYQIANDQTAAAATAANAQAMNEYGTQILSGGGSPDLQAKLLADPRLTFAGKDALVTAMAAHAEESPSAAAAAYGNGFYKARGQILAEPGDPSRISDPIDIYKRAAADGDLTLMGAQKLVELMGSVKKDVNTAQVQSAMQGLMAYAKSKLSFQEDTGQLQIKDPEGEKLFNARFVPQFQSAFETATKDGKDPWQFLTQDNVDKMLGGLRNPHEMAMAKLMAQQGIDTSTIVAPPAPEGLDPDGWKMVVSAPPVNPKTNQPLAPANWQGIVQALVADPSDATKKIFDGHFSALGITADDVLGAVTPPGATLPKPKPVPAAPTYDKNNPNDPRNFLDLPASAQ